MASDWNARAEARRLLERERGTVRKDAPRRIALVYPSPYSAAMSSLGYQTLYRLLNQHPEIAADRATLPDPDPGAGPLITLEREEPVASYPVIGFSVAYELELAGVVRCLELAGLPVRAADRTDDHPLVIAGGPLTFSNPRPLAPLCDVIVMGEAEETLFELLEVAAAHDHRRADVAAALAGRPGFYVPTVDGDRLPEVVTAPDSMLPASSQILTPAAELSDMYLVEAVRGCSRSCAYCVMRRSTGRGMRLVDVTRILDGIPAQAPRVGLVGASVTDHPRLVELVEAVVGSGRQIGISSLRADRLTDPLVELLARGGYRTLTVAADGASARLRGLVDRRIETEHLLRSAELTRDHGLHTLKLYVMVGLPGEEDSDIDELVGLVTEMARIHPRIALGVAPFVAKRNTPLDGAEFAGVSTVKARLDRLRRGLGKAATVRPTSARWAWIEYVLAQAGAAGGLAVIDAVRAGARFADYRKAFQAHGCA